MHTYIVSGADRNTGEDVRREYTAPSAQDAEFLANQDGIMVQRVDVTQPATTTPEELTSDPNDVTENEAWSYLYRKYLAHYSERYQAKGMSSSDAELAARNKAMSKMSESHGDIDRYLPMEHRSIPPKTTAQLPANSGNTQSATTDAYIIVGWLSFVFIALLEVFISVYAMIFLFIPWYCFSVATKRSDSKAARISLSVTRILVLLNLFVLVLSIIVWLT